MLAGTIFMDGISGNIQASLKVGSIEGNTPTHQANMNVGAGQHQVASCCRFNCSSDENW